MTIRTLVSALLAALGTCALALPGCGPAAKPAPLYIVCIGPNPNGDRSSLHLLTARVLRAEDLKEELAAVPVTGPVVIQLPSNPDKSRVPPIAAPQRRPGEIDVRAGNAGIPATLSGHLEPRGEKFFAHLSGAFGISSGEFEGEVELDKRHQPNYYNITAGGVYPFCFIVSHNSDPALFLKTPFFQIADSKDSTPAGPK